MIDYLLPNKRVITKYIWQYCQKNEYIGAKLNLLGRFGKTGAAVYSVVFDAKFAETRKYVIKIDNKNNISREYRAHNKVRNFFNNVANIEDYNTIEEYGVILYESAGDKELKRVLDNYVGGDYLYIRDYFDCVFSALPKAKDEEKKISIEDGFKDHLRKGVGYKYLQTFCRDYFCDSHIKLISDFLQLNISFIIAPIHGDLHPSNIMISDNGCKFIDFAWAKTNGIAAIDYAMMENSIQFMWAPFWLPDILWEILSNYTFKNIILDNNNKECFVKEINAHLIRQNRNEEEVQEITKWGNIIWDCISILRKKAREKANLDINQILAARTALLIGQAKFQDYSPHIIYRELQRLLYNILTSA